MIIERTENNERDTAENNGGRKQISERSSVLKRKTKGTENSERERIS